MTSLEQTFHKGFLNGMLEAVKLPVYVEKHCLHRLSNFVQSLCPPQWGMDILFLLFPVSVVRPDLI